MSHLFTLLIWITSAAVQTVPLELTPQGFPPLEKKSPNKPLDQLMDSAKAWASYYNKQGYDVSDVTANSLTIEARNENAFFSYNVGVKYNYDIKYSLKVVFGEDKKYSLKFTVREIYAENVLLKATVADFYTPDGKLKDDYKDAKPALEKTANSIIKSFVGYIGS